MNLELSYKSSHEAREKERTVKNIRAEIFCVVGVATFICGLFLLLISLFNRTGGDVWLMDTHVYGRNLSVFAMVVAMIGGAATTYGLILFRKPPSSH